MRVRRIRVLLADDHRLVRAGFRALIESYRGMQVVAEAANPHEVLGAAARAHPDVVLMNLAMADRSGIEVTRELARVQPKARVVVLSIPAREENVLAALEAGATGFLVKDATVSELEQAIRSAAKGERFLSASVSRHVINGLLKRRTPPTARPVLTARQREVLKLVAEGKTTKQIAGLLELSPKTIETHRMQLMAKLSLHDIAGLVRYAVRIGLVSIEK